MPLSPEDWHQRYLEQAGWTGHIRKYLFEKSNLDKAGLLLDVGIGTGALEQDFMLDSQRLPFGLDIDYASLSLARNYFSALTLVQGDARWLPFVSGVFDISFCHFVLLWTGFPNLVVSEMARVTKPNGSVMAIAEPDYGGRIDFPEALDQIGEWQVRALQIQGADPQLGRKLLMHFNQAGLTEVEVGVVGGRWTIDHSQVEFESEWKVIETDLDVLQLSPAHRRAARQLKEKDASARFDGSRVLYVPTFYAWGRVPASA